MITSRSKRSCYIRSSLVIRLSCMCMSKRRRSCTAAIRYCEMGDGTDFAFSESFVNTRKCYYVAITRDRWCLRSGEMSDMLEKIDQINDVPVNSPF